LLREGRETGEGFNTKTQSRRATEENSPQLKLRAIFGCPCGTKPSRRKARVEKLEHFVKFKPQTPLREIIRLTAS
jgi:hypothetical protein